MADARPTGGGGRRHVGTGWSAATGGTRGTRGAGNGHGELCRERTAGRWRLSLGPSQAPRNTAVCCRHDTLSTLEPDGLEASNDTAVFGTHRAKQRLERRASATEHANRRRRQNGRMSGRTLPTTTLISGGPRRATDTLDGGGGYNGGKQHGELLTERNSRALPVSLASSQGPERKHRRGPQTRHTEQKHRAT